MKIADYLCINGIIILYNQKCEIIRKLFFLAILCSSLSFGQASNLGPSPGYSDFSFASNFVAGFSIAGSDYVTGFNIRGLNNNRDVAIEIKDSPFLDDDFKLGKTTIHNKSGFTARMRYNASKEVIEFLDDNETVRELLRRPGFSAEFDGNTYMIFDYIVANNGIQKMGYFNPLNKGNIQLLYKPEKKMKLSSYSFQERKSAYYVNTSSYFIKKQGLPAVMVALNQMDIIKHLGEKYEKPLYKYITTNHLNLKKEGDVISLIEFYNAMIASPTEEQQS
ncbi:hypothetical protein ACOCEA_01510 [Maribacter sp. CXY002]|uniref:hypothetical protein n=1 Tax=Maribacter luteocoastalis TaxID=3407671 RepID=UPI003B6765CB